METKLDFQLNRNIMMPPKHLIKDQIVNFEFNNAFDGNKGVGEYVVFLKLSVILATKM